MMEHVKEKNWKIEDADLEGNGNDEAHDVALLESSEGKSFSDSGYDFSHDDEDVIFVTPHF